MYSGTEVVSSLLSIFVPLFFLCIWVGTDHHYDSTRGLSSLTNFTIITNPHQVLQQFLLQYNKNGWILSKSVEQDIQIILSVSNADVIYFNWFNREIEVFNFTLHNPNSTNTTLLRMGYFHVTWNSYLWPSFQIQVQNLDILLEFTNIFLTDTNWNELNESGFPPKILWSNHPKDDEMGESKKSDSSVRIGSLDLTGNVTLQIRSRPLEKDIVPILVLDFGMLGDWNQRITQMASNKQNNNGCTTDEILSLMVEFVQEKVDHLLQDVAVDLFTNILLEDNIEKSIIVQHGKKIVQGLQESAEQYMKSLAEQTGTKVGKHIADTLNAWGLL